MKSIKHLCIFVVMFSLLIILLSSCSQRNNIDENKRTGEKIITALFAYKQTHSVFPNTLKDLVPDYLNQFPKTVGGQEFLYGVDLYGNFELGFEVEARNYCSYSDSLKDWECSHYGE